LIYAYGCCVSGLWKGSYHHCYGKTEFKFDKATWMILAW
jgi:hypothetical protein